MGLVNFSLNYNCNSIDTLLETEAIPQVLPTWFQGEPLLQRWLPAIVYVADCPKIPPLLFATILTLLYTPFFLWSERRRAARNPQKAPPWAPERRLEVRRWKMEQTCSENLESMLQHGIIDHKRLWAWQPISLDNGNWKYSTNTNIYESENQFNYKNNTINIYWD